MTREELVARLERLRPLLADPDELRDHDLGISAEYVELLSAILAALRDDGWCDMADAPQKGSILGWCEFPAGAETRLVTWARGGWWAYGMPQHVIRWRPVPQLIPPPLAAPNA